MYPIASEKTTMLIDGLCNICSRTVKFTVEHDPKSSIQFAALQSPAGQKLLTEYGLQTNNFTSFVLIENNKAYTKSTGALKYFRKLTPPWSFLHILIVIPRPIRDFFYDIIATNRYRWFGKMDQCLVPSSELRSRFLEWTLLLLIKLVLLKNTLGVPIGIPMVSRAVSWVLRV